MNTRKATSVVCLKDLGHYLPAIEASINKGPTMNPVSLGKLHIQNHEMRIQILP
jgi:hypothetical protein